MTARSQRPAVRWHGGKWRDAPWIVSNMPRHDVYTEAFGGGASAMLRKPRARAEVYNDLDGTIVHLFRVLQDRDQARELVRLLMLTPFARAEFDAAYEPTDDPVEAARRTLVRSFMGYGSDGTAGVYKTGFRRTVSSTLKLPAGEWSTYPDALQRTIDRLRGVVIEQIDAKAIIAQMDSPGALHYVDPPYLPETRSQGNRRRGAGYHVYTHELSRDDHVELLALLNSVDGRVILSGYPSELYDDTLVGWQRKSRRAWADGGRERTEVIWINPAAQRALCDGPLFATGEAI